MDQSNQIKSYQIQRDGVPCWLLLKSPYVLKTPRDFSLNQHGDLATDFTAQPFAQPPSWWLGGMPS